MPNVYFRYLPNNMFLLSAYTGVADKSLARPTSRYILFDGNLVIYK